MVWTALFGVLALAPSVEGSVKVDAFFTEWADAPLLLANRVVSGELADANDLTAQVQIGWSERSIYFAVQAKDDLFQTGLLDMGDRLELVFAPPGAKKPLRVQVVLNGLESPPPELKLNGRPLKGGKVVGTYRKGGWAVEGSFPLKTIPGLVGQPMPFAAVIHDSDYDAVAADAVISTGPVDAQLVPTLPTIQLDPAAGAMAMLKADRGELSILRDMRGDLTGDGIAERVLITARDVVVMGHALPGGAQYFYFTHGWRTEPEIERADLQQLDGRPGKELFVQRREWSIPGEVQVDVVEIYGVSNGVMKRMFAHKIAERVVGKKQSAVSKVKFTRAKRGARRIIVPAAKVEGFNPGNYVDVDQGQMPFEPLPMPWEDPKGWTYALEGGFWIRQ